MNKAAAALALLACLCLIGAMMTGEAPAPVPAPADDPYDRAAAVAYADAWAQERNPEYANLESNCTNYVSQVLAAGGKRMDEPEPPKPGVRIRYHADGDKWYCTSIHTQPDRWREFSMSTSFCRTSDFVRYWTERRGMKLTRYDNVYAGMNRLYMDAEPGDVILLYREDEKTPSHLCVLVERANRTLLINANTKDFYRYNLFDVSPVTYPRLGLLRIR